MLTHTHTTTQGRAQTQSHTDERAKYDFHKRFSLIFIDNSLFVFEC